MGLDGHPHETGELRLSHAVARSASATAAMSAQTSRRATAPGLSTRGGGSRSSARQRTPITEAPEEPAPTPAQPPSSLPGLMNMTPADLATMLQQLKAQTDSMVRAQDLQAKENARIMTSISFLTSSIGAEEDLADLDSTD